MPNPPSPYLSPPPPLGHGHGRRHSFGQAPAWVGSGWSASPVVPKPPPEKQLIHPWLDGAKYANDLYLDLSAPVFAPRRRTADGKLHDIPSAELDAAATHPASTQMTIAVPGAPDWPIELRPAPPSPLLGVTLDVPAWATGPADSAPPISLRDVLESIYRHLQAQITHMDWAKLQKSEEVAISRAYTRRTRAAYQADHNTFEAELGVKRIDYLLEQHMFRGLKPAKGTENFETTELVLSRNK
jgi:hypothetical protein